MMKDKTPRRTGLMELAVILLLTPVMAWPADLRDAFKAAFGKPPPVTRHANLPDFGDTALRLEPLRLIPLGGTRFALVVTESFQGAHAASGNVAVAYLDRDSTGWRPIRVWYELAQSGSFGIPFPRHKTWSFNFGGTPFFAGESEYCGMQACTRWYQLIGFNAEGPVDWGAIPASGALELGAYTLPDGDGLTGCGGYEFSSVITPPAEKSDVMHVTYTGWMIPGGKGKQRRRFQVSAEAFLNQQGAISLRPEVSLPNCGA